MRFATISAVAAMLFASPLAAAQFAVQVEGAVPDARPDLLTALRITEIDEVDLDSRHFIVLEAPNDAYVEAYVYALDINAIALYMLEADWNGAGLSSLPIEARAPFLQSASCSFCSN